MRSEICPLIYSCYERFLIAAKDRFEKSVRFSPHCSRLRECFDVQSIRVSFQDMHLFMTYKSPSLSIKLMMCY